MRNIGRACLARLRRPCTTRSNTIDCLRPRSTSSSVTSMRLRPGVSSRKFRSIASPARSGRRRRVWDGVVSTGAAKALDPDLFYQLAILYTRLDSFGEKYIRYNDFTEQRLLPLGPAQPGVYDAATGRLKPEYVAYVDRLRDLEGLAKQLDAKAAMLKTRLDALQ
jgi:hypothetical protein